jgi:DNA-binding MarR family transcriptional regulator
MCSPELSLQSFVVDSDVDRDTVADLRALLLSGHRFRQAVADHFEVSLSEIVMLGNLAAAGGELSPSDLGDRMLLRSGTLTAIIDRLVQAGYVERRAHRTDRRRVVVRITAAGRRAARFVQHHLLRALDAAGYDGAPAALASVAAALEGAADEVRRR